MTWGVTYAELYDFIGTDYGSGDGSTTFNIPDRRGLFPRSWDHGRGVDPDRSSRTDRGDGTTGDHVGTRQGDEFRSHYHLDGYKNRALSGRYGIVGVIV